MEFNNKTRRLKLIFTLYLPWLSSVCIQYDPLLSYLCAWLGSFFILYVSILSSLAFHQTDLTMRLQIMRPLILIQLVFVGFMCTTSIFYFLMHLATLVNTESPFSILSNEYTELIAQCQRHALLAHAALVTGMVIVTSQSKSINYKIKFTNRFPLKLSITLSLAVFLCDKIAGMSQLKIPLSNIIFSIGTYLFVKGIHKKTPEDLTIGGTMFLAQLLYATTTGYKELVIVQIILLCCFLFHLYPKTILFSIPAVLILLIFILPTFTNVIRIQSWKLGRNNYEAQINAYESLINNQSEQYIFLNTKEFLTNRASEMGMFVNYLQKDRQHDHQLGIKILSQSLYALIPKIFWPEKPSTEKLAMERVYRMEIASRESNVSAKTRPIVDAYLIAGSFGIFIYMLLYGILCQILCNKAEQLFGGYQLGCCIMFNSIFQPLWRGNSIEFLLNNIFYGFLLLLLMHFAMKNLGILNPRSNEDYTY